jgi:hypothetical protein
MADKLTRGTALVAGTGVIFDVWVSVWLVGRPDTRITKLITLSILAVLAVGLFIMLQGWQEQRASES